MNRSASDKLLARLLEAEHQLTALIGRTSESDVLMQDACQVLRKALQAAYVWIYHTDRPSMPRIFISTSLKTAGSQFGQQAQEFARVRCLKQVQKQQGQELTSTPFSSCPQCALGPLTADHSTLTGPLGYRGRTYGYFAVSLDRDWLNDNENQKAIEAMASRLGRALYVLKLENECGIAHYLSHSDHVHSLQLFETYAAIILVIDPNTGEIIYANQAAAVFYGWSQAQLTQMKIQDINILSDAEIRREMQRARTTRRTYFDFRHRRADGSIRDVEVFSNRIPLGKKDVLLSIIHDVTEKKQAVKMLKEAEEHYRLIFNAGEDALFIHLFRDQGFGPIVQVNTAASKMLGYSREEFLQMTPADFSEAADARKRDIQKKRKQLRIRQEVSFEAVHIHKNGSRIPVDIKSTLITYYGEQAILSVVRNIKERKEAEQYLRNSQANLASLIDARDDLIWSVDTECSFIVFNQAMQQVFLRAFNKQLEPGMNSLELLPEKLYDFWKGKFDAALAGKRLEFEYESLLSNSGSVLLVTMNPILEDDQVCGVACIGTDISQTISLYRQLIKAEERMLLAFETSPDAITISQLEDGRFISVNEAFTKITGYSKEEAVGKTSYELNIWPNPEDRLRLGQLLKEQQFVNNYEVSFQMKNGKLITGLLSARILELNGIPHLLSVTRDISDRIEMEETLRQLNQELEDRVKQRTTELEAALHELESFSYSVSHDLRAPLRAISGFSTILEKEYHDKLDQEGHRLLGILRQNSERMTNLISDLLTFSRFSRMPMKYDAIDMEQLVTDVTRELMEVHDSNMNLIVGQLPAAYGDRRLIYQVWMNLLDNAIKFSRNEAHPRIEISGLCDGNNVQYQIKDNGCGYDPQFAHKLFQVFQRLHRDAEFEGTGIGLSIVQRIIQRHKGFIWAKSVQGAGATFYFTLPADHVDIAQGESDVTTNKQAKD